MKTQKSFYSLLLVLFVIPFCGFAQKQDTLNAYLGKYAIGDQVTKIVAQGTFTLILEQGAESSISFDTAYAQSVHYSIDKDVLTINSEQDKVWIKLKNISEITSKDVTNIKSKGTITTPTLKISLSDASTQTLAVSSETVTAITNDAAKLILNGKTLNLILSSNDASSVRAEMLEATNVKANTKDASTAWVNATETIDGQTHDVSSLHYFEKAKTVNIESSDVSKSEKFNQVNIDENAQAISIPMDSINNMVTDILVDIDSTFKDKPQNKSKWPGNFFKKNKFDGNWGGIMLGFNNVLNSNNEMEVPVGYEFLDVDFTGSRTFALNLFEKNFSLIGNKFGVTTGLGFQWYNYRFAKNAQLFANQDAINGMLDTVNASKYEKSKLAYTMLNIPLLLEFQTNPNHNKKSFHINAGVIFGVKLCSHTKTIIEDGATTKITVSDDFNLNPIRLDATASIGYDIANLFVSYSLTPLFKEKEGPKLYPFTAGIYLLLW
jgi:hypothetical protein